MIALNQHTRPGPIWRTGKIVRRFPRSYDNVRKWLCYSLEEGTETGSYYVARVSLNLYTAEAGLELLIYLLNVEYYSVGITDVGHHAQLWPLIFLHKNLYKHNYMHGEYTFKHLKCEMVIRYEREKNF